jgi:ADP-heptose:LPS heptosyltransferase
VIDALAAERSLRAILLGSASEKAMNAEAASLVRKARVTNLSGQSTLPEALGVLAEAALFVGNDSGISHLAAAAGTPAVVVFGPTDPDATRPWDGPRVDGHLPRVAIVRRPPLCAPCRFRVCPIDHACMRQVEASAVLAAARSLLSAPCA